MRELPVARIQAKDEKGKLHCYDYGILVGEMAVASGIFCESYGVKVSEEGGECHEIPNITVSISRIDELIDLLVRNVVSPCTVHDVINDWL